MTAAATFGTTATLLFSSGLQTAHLEVSFSLRGAAFLLTLKGQRVSWMSRIVRSMLRRGRGKTSHSQGRGEGCTAQKGPHHPRQRRKGERSTTPKKPSRKSSTVHKEEENATPQRELRSFPWAGVAFPSTSSLCAVLFPRLHWRCCSPSSS